MRGWTIVRAFEHPREIFLHAIEAAEREMDQPAQVVKREASGALFLDRKFVEQTERAENPGHARNARPAGRAHPPSASRPVRVRNRMTAAEFHPLPESNAR
jgi:hypothetical protein